MSQDLSSFPKGTIIQNHVTKKLYLVTDSQDLHIHRVKLLNISDYKEETYEALADRPIAINYDPAKAPYSYKELDFQFVEDFLLDKPQAMTLKSYLENLGRRDTFQADYNKILKTSDVL